MVQSPFGFDESPFGFEVSPVYWVSDIDIRAVFNALNMAERVRRGDLWIRVDPFNNHRISRQMHEDMNEPRTTRSQMVDYFAGPGWIVARVHQLRRVDGSLRGIPDPKSLYLRDCTLKFCDDRHTPQLLPPQYQSLVG